MRGAYICPVKNPLPPLLSEPTQAAASVSAVLLVAVPIATPFRYAVTVVPNLTAATWLYTVDDIVGVRLIMFDPLLWPPKYT
jgi:hypothetical protein